MPARVDDLVLRLEAVLFASGKPLSVGELAAALGFGDHRPVQRALRTLARIYEGRQTAIELRRMGDRLALQLREEFVMSAQSVTPVDLAPRTLRALTLIAYHQPLKQSRLVKMFGETTYEEVGRLRQLGLIRAEPFGPTLELTTTRRFAEYFGLPSTDPIGIREYLSKKMGPAGIPLAAIEPPEAQELPPTPKSEPAELDKIPDGVVAPPVGE